MPRKSLKALTVLSIACLTLAACSSIDIQAPTGVERGQWDGAGAQ